MSTSTEPHNDVDPQGEVDPDLTGRVDKSGRTARAEQRAQLRGGVKEPPKPTKEEIRERKRVAKVAKQERREENRTESRKKAAMPAARGWFGRGAGASGVVEAAPEWRGTTKQVCGLWPFPVGSGTPLVGVPLGRHIGTGATLCCDPISWFQRAKLIANPSVFFLGKPALGKSTTIRRMATGLAGYGTLPLVLGDLKPDYVDMVHALGGQVISLARGRGHLNVLDPGESKSAAARLRAIGQETAAQEVEADAHGRRLTMVSALVTILRKSAPSDVEESLIDQALRVVDRHHPGVPVLEDLLRVVQVGPPELREVAVDRGDWNEYQRITRGLEASLLSLARGGRLGEIFARPTSNPMRIDRAVVYDISGIKDSDGDLRAAALLACWSNGFATVNTANVLADHGLEPRRHYFVIMDELWQALRSGTGMVDRVDSLTRLNRQFGVGMAMITHTMSDLNALPTEEDRMKARGFVERSGMVIAGGLPRAEMPLLRSAIALSAAEEAMLASWQDPPAWDPSTNKEMAPPGRGKFLVKVGGRPGIPVHVLLTQAEKDINDTNKLWHEQSRTGEDRT